MGEHHDREVPRALPQAYVKQAGKGTREALDWHSAEASSLQPTTPCVPSLSKARPLEKGLLKEATTGLRETAHSEVHSGVAEVEGVV